MKFLIVPLLLIITSCYQKSDPTKSIPSLESKNKHKIEVLLLGSSHWNNYQHNGYDVAQTNQIDILSDQYQSDLDEIIKKIKEFNPDKIFVEREVSYQNTLDSLYSLYRTGSWGKDKRNEIFQLGFNTANQLNHHKVYGIDYRDTSFPYDSLLQGIKDANQIDLMDNLDSHLKEYETKYNKLVMDKTSLKQFFYFLNDDAYRTLDLGWYLNKANQGGTLENNVGSYLASEWIKRNVYMYGLIQKYVEPKDQRIMVLLGAGHISVIKNLVSFNPEWKTVELKDIM